RPAEALDVQLALVPAHDQILGQRPGFVGDQNLPGLGGAFQTAGQVHLAADDGVVHAHVGAEVADGTVAGAQTHTDLQDRKSTRLNLSHVKISYAVVCLKKKIV